MAKTNVGNPVQCCQNKKKENPEEEQDPKKHWIKFKIVDKGNSPIENVTLRIKFSNGSFVERKSDKDGMIEIKNIEPGNCKIETYWEGCTIGKTVLIK